MEPMHNKAAIEAAVNIKQTMQLKLASLFDNPDFGDAKNVGGETNFEASALKKKS